MSMRYWVVYDPNDLSVLGIVGKNKMPKNSVPAIYDNLTDEIEDARWLQIEEVDDGYGTMVKVATVDAALKSTIQAQDISDQAANDAAKATKMAEKIASCDKMRAFDKESVVGLAEIQEKLDNIVEFLEKHVGFGDH